MRFAFGVYLCESGNTNRCCYCRLFPGLNRNIIEMYVCVCLRVCCVVELSNIKFRFQTDVKCNSQISKEKRKNTARRTERGKNGRFFFQFVAMEAVQSTEKNVKTANNSEINRNLKRNIGELATEIKVNGNCVFVNTFAHKPIEI